MPGIRLSGFTKLGLCLGGLLFTLHLLATSFQQTAAEVEEVNNWGERFGLDHYADWEQGVTNKLGEHVDRIKGGFGVIAGWGDSGTKLGSLYELVKTSNPSPHPAYFDQRTLLDRSKLASTKVFGHGTEHPDAPSDLDPHPPTKRHILITGAFGSLGKHVVRDLLLGLSAKEGALTTPPVADEWIRHGAAAAAIAGAEDVLVTILDVADRTDELDFLLQNAPGALVGGPVGTDPRAAAFASSERSVGALVKSGKLLVVRGDVRDRSLMARLLSDKGAVVTRPSAKAHQEHTIVIPPVSGVIHLASYSPAKCAVNPVDCADVEKAGMESIVAALERKGVDKKATKDGKEAVVADRPWVVVPRRGDVWPRSPDSDPSKVGPSTQSIGPSQFALKAFTSRHPLHSLLLQLPSSDSIIGDPFAPRFDPAPHVIQSALGNLPIQVQTSSTMLDPFLAIRDATRAIIQGARMLELASRKDYVRLMGFVAEVEVVGPAPAGNRDGPVADLARTVVSMVSSHSALSDKVRLSSSEMAKGAASGRRRDGARKVCAKALGAAPSIPVLEAAKTYMEYLLIRQAAHLATKVNVACASPPSLGVLEEGMMGLGGCNAQLLTLIDGSYYSLACSGGVEGATTPLALLPAVPFEEGVRGVDLVVERGLEGKVDVQLKCPALNAAGERGQGKPQVVAWTDSKTGGQFASPADKSGEVIAEWFSVDFAERDTRAFTLTLPPTEGLPREEDPARRLTLHLPAHPEGELKFRVPANEAPALLFKVNPICCPAAPTTKKNAWDFFKEDPLITSQVTFATSEGKTTLASSTLALQRCHGLRAEHERLLAVQAALKRAKGAKFCEPHRGEANSWTASEYTTCSSDCEAPLACLASDKCKCTRDRCGNTGRLSPFPKVAYTDEVSFDGGQASAGGEPLRKRKWHLPGKKRAPVAKAKVKAAELTLSQKVAALPWDGLILPGARAAFNLKLDELPSVHVVALPASIDDHLETPSCWNLDKAALPLMGDHYLVEALRNVSVPIGESDFAVVPFYQGCYYNRPDHNTFKKLAETWDYAEGRLAGADQIVGSRIVVPFTHDYGSCTGWWPRLEEALGKEPPSPMDQAVAWQVNGDYNTRCVKPDQDVIVPAITKNTKKLISRFGDLGDVRPTAEREHLAFFSGTVRGFGAFARTRIGCGRRTSLDLMGLEGGSGGKGRVLYQELEAGGDYLGTLGNAKFCLLPRGVPAWTTRTFDAIFAGCIPVFLVDRALQPYQDVYDYAQFSLSIPENEAHRVEEVLAAVGEEEAGRMQVALLKVRESFVFREGGKGGSEEWERGARGEGRGPAWMGRVGMAMRLGLGYPSVGSCLAYHGER